jgi:Rv0078B-related antitoxin
MAVRDPKTEWLRVQVYRRMTPAERMEIAARMFEDGVLLVRSSILHRYPGISPDELEYEVRRRVLPRGMAELTEEARRSHGLDGTRRTVPGA